MSLVPLTEGGGVDLDDGTLDEGLGSEQLVVGGVVNLIDHHIISQPNIPFPLQPMKRYLQHQ